MLCKKQKSESLNLAILEVGKYIDFFYGNLLAKERKTKIMNLTES